MIERDDNSSRSMVVGDLEVLNSVSGPQVTAERAAAAAANAYIYVARGDLAILKEQLGGMDNDGVVSVFEKIHLRDTWRLIRNEKPIILEAAGNVGLGVGDAEYDAYITGFDGLSAVIQPLLLNISESSPITIGAMDTAVDAYYLARENLYVKIEEQRLSVGDGVTYDDLIDGVDHTGTNGDLTTTPIDVTLGGEGAYKSIILRWDKQLNLTNLARYELQVSDDQSDWYSLGMDGTGWAGAMNEWTSIVTELFVHPEIPSAGTSETPMGRILYYRIRRVTKESVYSDATAQSANITAMTMLVKNGDLAVDSLTANMLESAFLRVTTAIKVGVTEGLTTRISGAEIEMLSQDLSVLLRLGGRTIIDEFLPFMTALGAMNPGAELPALSGSNPILDSAVVSYDNVYTDNYGRNVLIEGSGADFVTGKFNEGMSGNHVVGDIRVSDRFRLVSFWFNHSGTDLSIIIGRLHEAYYSSTEKAYHPYLPAPEEGEAGWVSTCFVNLFINEITSASATEDDEKYYITGSVKVPMWAFVSPMVGCRPGLQPLNYLITIDKGLRNTLEGGRYIHCERHTATNGVTISSDDPSYVGWSESGTSEPPRISDTYMIIKDDLSVYVGTSMPTSIPVSDIVVFLVIDSDWGVRSWKRFGYIGETINITSPGGVITIEGTSSGIPVSSGPHFISVELPTTTSYVAKVHTGGGYIKSSATLPSETPPSYMPSCPFGTITPEAMASLGSGYLNFELIDYVDDLLYSWSYTSENLAILDDHVVADVAWNPFYNDGDFIIAPRPGRALRVIGDLQYGNDPITVVEGPQGPQGIQGIQGDQGDQGDIGYTFTDGGTWDTIYQPDQVIDGGEW